jgi:Mrp family chromosome partitioning ATPase
MSVLDRAFIKAYSPYRSQPADAKSDLARPAPRAVTAAPTLPVGQPVAPAAKPELAASASPADSIPTVEVEFEAPIDPPAATAAPETALPETAAPTLPLPNTTVPSPSLPKTTAAKTGPSAPADSTAAHPLSSFRGEIRFEESLQPLLEVDSFIWPPQCATLMRLIPWAWEAFAKELTNRGARGQKVIVMTGCRRGEGRTTAVLCAARQLGQSGVKTVIVDADFEKPGLARRLGVSPQTGWEAAVEGELPLSELLIASVADRLVLLPWEAPPGPPHRLVDNVNVALTFDMLRAQFDVILLDAGPVEASADSWHSGLEQARPDAVYVVSDFRTTHTDQIEELARRLGNRGVAIAGVLENFVAAGDAPAPNPLNAARDRQS